MNVDAAVVDVEVQEMKEKEMMLAKKDAVLEQTRNLMVTSAAVDERVLKELEDACMDLKNSDVHKRRNAVQKHRWFEG